MIVSQPVEKLWAKLNNATGIPWSSDFKALGLVKSDCLVAVVGYNGFTGRVCFMHNAIDDPSRIDRTFVRESFRYPFEICGLEEVLAPVPADNERALSLNFHLGFREVHRIPGGALEGSDLLLLSMRKAECRFLKGKFDGKEERSSGT